MRQDDRLAQLEQRWLDIGVRYVLQRLMTLAVVNHCGHVRGWPFKEKQMVVGRLSGRVHV